MSNGLKTFSKRPQRNISERTFDPIGYLKQREHYLGPPNLNLKIKFFLTGCLFPLLCASFSMTGGGIGGKPSWQSGHYFDYVQLLLHSRAQLIFLPLILYSISSLLIWLIWPRSIDYLALRLGIYAGIPLALQFLILVSVVSFGITLVLSLVVAPSLAFLVYLASLLARNWRLLFYEHLWVLIVIFVIVGSIAFYDVLPTALLVVPIIALAGSPALTVVTFIRATVMVSAEHQRQHKWERRSLLIWLFAFQGLAAAWFASWRMAIDVMLFEYSKLPKTPPQDCYLSAAAQQRHTWLFGESTAAISLQTKRLKFLEFALRSAAPGFHTALRRIYNHYGPPLAAFCRKSPWFADLTYLSLLPLECLSMLLSRILKIRANAINNIYSNQE